MTPHDTSPGDDPQRPSTPGERVDDWIDVGTGKKPAFWKRGRFRNPGAQGCSTLVLTTIVVIAVVAALASWP